MPTPRLYRIAFLNPTAGQGQPPVYEIYARSVSHGSMPGFVEIEKLVFGERTSILVDPVEEKLKAEFANVVRTFVPVHAIVRIDQVDKAGTARIMAGGESGKVMPFPGSTFGGSHQP